MKGGVKRVVGVYRVEMCCLSCTGRENFCEVTATFLRVKHSLADECERAEKVRKVVGIKHQKARIVVKLVGICPFSLVSTKFPLVTAMPLAFEADNGP